MNQKIIKVAGVLSNRRLAINIGSQDGSKQGDVYGIFSPEPPEVYDPDNKERLGKIDGPKTTVRVVYAKERFSICEAIDKGQLINPDEMPIFPSSFDPDMGSVITKDKVPDDLVRIGDIARLRGISDERNISN